MYYRPNKRPNDRQIYVFDRPMSERPRKIASLTYSSDPYNRLDFRCDHESLIASQDQLQFEIEKALRILQVTLTEVFADHGIAIPAETIIIGRTKRRAIRTQPTVNDEDAAITDELRNEIIIEDAPVVEFKDIGGQRQAVEEAKDLAQQLANPKVFENWGVEPPRGILLYGTPGNGKTLIAKALANEADAVFMSVNIGNIVNKWYGESEKRVKEIFSIARSEAQSTGKHAILFLDEVDSLIVSRNANSADNVTRRVVGMMLQEIDGLKSTGNITVIASTNTPEALDNAFLSRMTKWIEVPNPDLHGIEEIMRIHFSRSSEKSGRELLSPDVDFETIAKGIAGNASGRDIADAVQVVLTNKAKHQLKEGTVSVITTQDIINAIKSMGKIQNTF